MPIERDGEKSKLKNDHFSGKKSERSRINGNRIKNVAMKNVELLFFKKVVHFFSHVPRAPLYMRVLCTVPCTVFQVGQNIKKT